MPKISLNASKKTKLTAAGEIPVDWRCSKLGDLLTQPVSGVSVLADEKPPERGQPGVLRLSCVTGGRFDPNDLKSPQNGQAQRLGVTAEHNTILISRSNTPNLVGESAYVTGEHPSAFLPDTLWLLRPKEPDKVSMAWLGYMLRSSHYRRLLKQIASGTSQSMKKIQKGALLKLHAPTPPLPEQEKIAEILSTWDDALEKLDALIDAKERRKKGLMQRVLTGKHRIKGSKGSVEFRRASEIFVNRSERNSKSFPILSVTQDQGVVLRSSLERRIAHNEGTNGSYKVVRNGDFVISLRSFQGGLEYSEIDGAVSPAYHVISPIAPISSRFYRHYFKSQDFIGRLAIAVIGIRDGKQISFTDFGFIRIPYPHPEDQERIATLLDSCDAELTLLHRQRDALDLQKRGLMQRLLTGRIRITV